jgi:TPR repeat protein
MDVPEAQRELAALLAMGRGGSLDYTQAAGWYQRAAELGDAQAQFSLGVLYYRGLGKLPDVEKARHWWTLAAAQGEERARKNLALLAKGVRR